MSTLPWLLAGSSILGAVDRMGSRAPTPAPPQGTGATPPTASSGSSALGNAADMALIGGTLQQLLGANAQQNRMASQQGAMSMPRPGMAQPFTPTAYDPRLQALLGGR